MVVRICHHTRGRIYGYTGCLTTLGDLAAQGVRDHRRGPAPHHGWRRVVGLGESEAPPPCRHRHHRVGAPSTSRDAIVTVMSPDTVAWMLRQMNPIKAARIGTRQGTGMLSSAAFPGAPTGSAGDTAEASGGEGSGGGPGSWPTVGRSAAGGTRLGHRRGAMVAQFPMVGIDGRAKAARDSLQSLAGDSLTISPVYSFSRMATLWPARSVCRIWRWPGMIHRSER